MGKRRYAGVHRWIGFTIEQQRWIVYVRKTRNRVAHFETGTILRCVGGVTYPTRSVQGGGRGGNYAKKAFYIFQILIRESFVNFRNSHVKSILTAIRRSCQIIYDGQTGSHCVVNNNNNKIKNVLFKADLSVSSAPVNTSLPRARALQAPSHKTSNS